MAHHICVHCGLQCATSPSTPLNCPNCSDERESISHQPQSWTSLELLVGNYTNVFTDLGDGVTGIVTRPTFAIGQEIYLIQTDTGNIIWDCLAYVDNDTVAVINKLGGLRAVVVSHPHFIGSALEWSSRFGNCPVFVHALNKPWLGRTGSAVKLWEQGALEILPGLNCILCGGHFPGSCILHWSQGAGGRGAIFTSDTILPRRSLVVPRASC
jgi:glyoxylase-like metal-dependent hydrolase (beta-lactamase superfamily II)